MANPISRVIFRLGRSLLSVAIAGAVATLKDNPFYLGIAPVLQALGKYLRETWKLKNIPF